MNNSMKSIRNSNGIGSGSGGSSSRQREHEPATTVATVENHVVIFNQSFARKQSTLMRSSFAKTVSNIMIR